MKSFKRTLTLLILHVCLDNVLLKNVCKYDADFGNATTHKALADYIKFSLDYKVDPCEDFYMFSCGNWIKNTNGTPPYWGEISSLHVLDRSFQQAQAKELLSNKTSTSMAITQARNFYNSCVSAGKAWNQSENSGIKYVMGKIKEFGVFPMLSETALDESKFNASFDLTWLLAYFNQNKTVLHTIAPRIVFNKFMTRSLISFYPSRSLFSFLSNNFAYLRTHFIQFLLSLVKRIAVDIGVNYDKTNAPPDILQMVIFMSKLHSIPVPHLGQLLKDNDFFNESEFRNLSNVDIGITQVNWTQYFLLVAPPEVHHVLLSNPPVALPDEEYLGRLDGLLNETSPRTITNYVMIQYILSWIPLLGDEYRSLLERFVWRTNNVMSRDRSHMCLIETKRHFSLAIMAMYARSFSKKAPKAEIEGMVLEIIGGLKDEVKENEWMDDEFKKAVLQKLNKITWSLIDDDMFYNDTALDEEYSAHIGLANLPFLDMLESITSIEKVESFRKLSVTLDLRKELAKFSVMGYQINAYYTTLLNRIMIPLPFLEFPLFERKYPRSFLYGSIGHVIGHELSHSLDTQGMEYDGDGVQRKWWKDEWVKQYTNRTKCFVDRYSKVKIPKFNTPLNGTVSVGENIADNEGMKIAYRAYRQHSEKYHMNKFASIEDFTNDQLFFLGFSLTWCSKMSDFTLFTQANSDHSPGVYRVVTTLSNFPPFAKAFFCSQKSRMNEGAQCSLW